MMKKQVLVALVSLAPIAAMSQSAIDVYNLSSSQLRGTARFMSMGGAFTALGGDLSTLNQNPAGLGIYRSSEIGATLDIDMQSSKTNSGGYSLTDDQTKVACDNFGYVGTANLGSDIMPYFSWGVSYGRVASFDRVYRGGSALEGSLSNYIANFTNGVAQRDLTMTNNYDPYYDGYADWLSILAYNAYMINPYQSNNEYRGLWTNGVSSGNTMFSTRESGYIDEYNIDFGGNIMNTVYWGVGFGITDLNYRQETYYDEVINGASIESGDGHGTIQGNAEYALSNWKHTTGNGFNFKVGLIFKPINEFRLGVAVHTPTYYDMQTTYNGMVDYEYTNPRGEIQYSSYDGGDPVSQTPYYYYDWKMRSPWRMMIGAAGVIGRTAIVSLDYERQAYNDMSAKDGNGYALDYVNNDIKDTFKATNIIRLGVEVRPTTNLSVRCGFNYATTNANEKAYDGEQPVYTAGTNPAYTLTDQTYCVTAGLGYRYHGFYADLAYVYRNKESKWNGFSSVMVDSYTEGYAYTGAPTAKLTDVSNHLVLSVGYKF